MLSKGTGFVLGWPEGGYPAPQVRVVVQHYIVAWFGRTTIGPRAAGGGGGVKH
jgi:hypothetical protein